MYRLITLILSLHVLSSSPLAQTASFEGLGVLGVFQMDCCQYYFSDAWDVSSDGSVVVGMTTSNKGFEAYRWEDGVMEGLGALPANIVDSEAFAVSSDGSVVVGYSISSSFGYEAWRWTAEDGMTGLDFISRSYSVSGDGSIIAGEGASGLEWQAFRWEDGNLEWLELLNGHVASVASGISADGSVIVGRSRRANGTIEALRWKGGETQALGHLPGGVASMAFAASADGSVIAGFSYLASGYTQAFRWNNGVMESLGHVPVESSSAVGSAATLPSIMIERSTRANFSTAFHRDGYGTENHPGFRGGGQFSQASAISGDGTVIGGHYSHDDMHYQAFIWTEEQGMQDLKEVLENDYGLNLDGWLLWQLHSISHDGTVIVGRGVSPDGHAEGWRAVLSSGVSTENVLAKGVQGLTPPSPNPIRERATFELTVEHGQQVTVEVFDIMGRRVQVLYEGSLNAGATETLRLNATALSSGVYVIRAVGEDFVDTRRVTVVR